jgi:hypothetical protein
VVMAVRGVELLHLIGPTLLRLTTRTFFLCINRPTYRLQQHEKTLILPDPMWHYGVAAAFNQPLANGVRQ